MVNYIRLPEVGIHAYLALLSTSLKSGGYRYLPSARLIIQLIAQPPVRVEGNLTIDFE